MAVFARWALFVGLSVAVLSGCNEDLDPDARGQAVGYRRGIAPDGYTSNGERGNVELTEVMWSGSVRDDGQYDPSDIFIEFRNKHPRPIHMTGWQLIVTTGTGDLFHDALIPRGERPRRTWTIPEREGGGPVYTNEYVTLATRRDGAFADADFFLEDLALPKARFGITLRDLDDRLIGGAGDAYEDTFAGGFDLVTSRSMERVQILFSNNSARNSSWHAYSLNPWDADHLARTINIADGYREHTFASPGRAPTPDYSGNTSAGSYE
jgi:hypothetical protein